MQESKSMSQFSRKTRRSMNGRIGKDKFNIIKVLNSKALIDSYISQDEFVSVKNGLRRDNEIIEEIKNSENERSYPYRFKKIK